MSKPLDAVEKNRKTLLTLSTTLADNGLDGVPGPTGRTVAGVLLEPIVWWLDYEVNEEEPSATDYMTYALGNIQTPHTKVAAFVVSVLNSVSDDQKNFLLKAVRAEYPAEQRKGIKACLDFCGLTGPSITAQQIAFRGGTAWLHPNGLWVYAEDKKKKLIPRFKPLTSKKIYQAWWPLRPKGGGFEWREIQGNWKGR